ncbi:DUF2934 domain-containing protein [Bradyrhizobium sp. RDM12]
MTHAYEDEIRARAYKLWEAAGEAGRRMDEFWCSRAAAQGADQARA